ncbi:YheC/YheD family protein [Paenibacillus sp. PsM32]|uniref:YheC/YheD family protein n=1 Tax=unclassified Paenibacillus TaxID=185978 RepID=UPI002365327C|nr:MULTISPECIES: YheC/YheD family protein [unclassified Paenibacillus]MDN4619214.1 YheC/YheD family protein [Paenibacillus sp. PsM32]MDQ1236895.1 hypothetical protein [Paenibacillus sp. SORGH_AS_0306]MDR6109257.1 hypothetical protein [Paenibacillus sp. SORGH_AS_0338]WDF50605.1 YheC/YheD family protein [Paenibacillus sp. KACC 21273]
MEKRLSIGMMIGWKIRLDLPLACALIAHSQEVDFFYFYPAGVDEQTRTIEGQAWDGTQWITGTFAYPDVIYDRMRRKGSDQFGNIYEKLAGIPITHTLRGRSIVKTKVYNVLRGDANLKKSLIPFMTMRDPEKVIEFVHKHQRVIFKADGGASAQNMFTVEVKDDGYEVFDQTYLHTMNQEQMLEVVTVLIERRYCAQKLIQSTTVQEFPFFIRVHVSKDGQGQWMVAFCSVSLSLNPMIKVTNSESTFRVTTTWTRFLNHQFGEQPGGSMDRKIQAYAIEISQYLEQQWGTGFHEIGLDLGIDKQNKIRLFEAGLGIPDTSFHNIELAQPAIAYCQYLVRQSQSS